MKTRSRKQLHKKKLLPKHKTIALFAVGALLVAVPFVGLQLGPKNSETQTNTPITTKGACTPRLSCLDNIPACKVRTPVSGWCSPTLSGLITKEKQFAKKRPTLL